MKESSPEGADRRPIDLSSLTDREREVLAVAVSGASVSVIAEALTLSEATVRSHLAHIYTKLDVTGRIELLARLNGSLTGVDRGDDQSASRSEPASRRDRRLVAGLLVSAAMAIAIGAFAVLRPDLPPPTDIGSVSTLVAQGQVASLDLGGNRLFVATVDGRRLRIDGVDRTAVDALQAAAVAHGVDVSAGGDTDATLLLMAGASIFPFALLALALGWFLRTRRGPLPTAAR